MGLQTGTRHPRKAPDDVFVRLRRDPNYAVARKMEIGSKSGAFDGAQCKAARAVMVARSAPGMGRGVCNPQQ